MVSTLDHHFAYCGLSSGTVLSVSSARDFLHLREGSIVATATELSSRCPPGTIFPPTTTVAGAPSGTNRTAHTVGSLRSVWLACTAWRARTCLAGAATSSRTIPWSACSMAWIYPCGWLSTRRSTAGRFRTGASVCCSTEFRQCCGGVVSGMLHTC